MVKKHYSSGFRKSHARNLLGQILIFSQKYLTDLACCGNLSTSWSDGFVHD